VNEKQSRNELIIQLRNAGFSLKEIGEKVSLSHERVRQIIAKKKRIDAISAGTFDSLSVRARGGLVNLGLGNTPKETIKDMIYKDVCHFFKQKGLGRKTFNEICQWCGALEFIRIPKGKNPNEKKPKRPD